MNYRNRETGEVSKDTEIRVAHSNVSFGRNTFDDLGYDVIFKAPMPTPSTSLKVIGANGVVQDANGNWVEAWIERDMFSDTTENGVTTTKAEHETAYTAKMEAEAAAAAQAASKVEGIEILGVMCSATKEDQMGLTAVGLDYSMTTAAGGTFADTEFNFQNGTTLVITSENFSSIYEIWVPFRRGFFAVA